MLAKPFPGCSGVTAESQTRSVPGLGCRKRSARRAISFSRKIGDDQLLPAQLVGALDARGQHGMAFRGVAADNDHQAGVFDVA